MGSGYSLDLKVKEGAGAFVCGESTALQYSIEGGRGMPRPRPPQSVEAGLWDKPTLLNNVETFSNVPRIIQVGLEKYLSYGSEKSGGTKIFALSGAIKNAGLIEVPIGMTLREVIFDVGGGIPKKKKFKSVAIGGPSGGCLPDSVLDYPVDFETLIEAGAMMGSGSMVVCDEDTCMVELSRFFMEFCADESCGKCTPCRVGNTVLLDMLTRLTTGEGQDRRHGPDRRVWRLHNEHVALWSGQILPGSRSFGYAILSGRVRFAHHRQGLPHGAMCRLEKIRDSARPLHRLWRMYKTMSHRGDYGSQKRDRVPEPGPLH